MCAWAVRQNSAIAGRVMNCSMFARDGNESWIEDGGVGICRLSSQVAESHS